MYQHVSGRSSPPTNHRLRLGCPPAVPLAVPPWLLQYLRRQHLADVTEIFRQVGPRKTREMFKLGFYLLTFILAIYRWAAGCAGGPCCPQQPPTQMCTCPVIQQVVGGIDVVLLLHIHSHKSPLASPAASLQNDRGDCGVAAEPCRAQEGGKGAAGCSLIHAPQAALVSRCPLPSLPSCGQLLRSTPLKFQPS